VNCQG